jgi:hypothetical protein
MRMTLRLLLALSLLGGVVSCSSDDGDDEKVAESPPLTPEAMAAVYRRAGTLRIGL